MLLTSAPGSAPASSPTKSPSPTSSPPSHHSHASAPTSKPSTPSLAPTPSATPPSPSSASSTSPPAPPPPITPTPSNAPTVTPSHRRQHTPLSGPSLSRSLPLPPPPHAGLSTVSLVWMVVTVFHEFGYALQRMLTKQDEGLVSGVQGIEWDAAELSSLFMEKWCYHKDTLMSIGKHYNTKKSIPESLCTDLLKNVELFRGLVGLHQICSCMQCTFLMGQKLPLIK
ncbi:protein TRACHEARY ELEMENT DIFFERENTIATION-RELATED 7A-like isoform X2 [Quercus robur]|uniref:protein TRACHEARY ELEMENT DIFFERENTIATION-RELATED 7A-like isoform X2 n=1 Tax=Quercus robur TaxID=38942 RepID=UPI0021631D5A|nr:protein TRACHEARY ELEMENT DIFFERENTIATION-RELATED 7A-like isoform X2 [Quercus robur]